ncbi:MAG TPA: hypothetical protein VJ953_06585 [Saprospiraceae bacterium]|nr:hypothetical protein [Saprospiraceae bacterium]
MKWYIISIITLVAIITAYILLKLFARTNVYYNIETEPTAPIPKSAADRGEACDDGTSNLGNPNLPLGFRNNNPLNLVKSANAWKGKIKDNPGRFEQFCSMEYGTRAAMINLRTYMNRYSRNTIRKIISRWAPASENDTEAYIRFVSQQTGYQPDTELSFQKEIVFNLIDAMSQQENGAGMLIGDLVKEQAWEMIT